MTCWPFARGNGGTHGAGFGPGPAWIRRRQQTCGRNLTLRRLEAYLRASLLSPEESVQQRETPFGYILVLDRGEELRSLIEFARHNDIDAATIHGLGAPSIGSSSASTASPPRTTSGGRSPNRSRSARSQATSHCSTGNRSHTCTAFRARGFHDRRRSCLRGGVLDHPRDLGPRAPRADAPWSRRFLQPETVEAGVVTFIEPETLR